MPWKIIPAKYDSADQTTLHDDELMAMEQALKEQMGQPHNEYNPRWRALEKVRPLAAVCDFTNDPTYLLPKTPDTPNDPSAFLP